MASVRSADQRVKKKRGRPRNASKATVQQSTQPKKRGRPSNVAKAAGRQSTETRLREPQGVVAKPKRTRNVPSQTQAEDAPVRVPRGRKRRVEEVYHDEIEQEAYAGHEIARLSTKHKRVSHEQLQTWGGITQPILDQISDMLDRAKVTIVQEESRVERRDETEKILNRTIENLERRLVNAKIPPQAKAEHFDLDKLNDRHGKILSDMTAARHQDILFNKHIEDYEERLKEQKKSLSGKENDAKIWEAKWKKQSRNGELHPLLQLPEGFSIYGDGPEDIRLRKRTTADKSTLDTSDKELAPFIEQLRRSLDSMQSNHRPVEGIDEAMLAAQWALDDRLFRHTGAQQFNAL